MKVPTTIVMSTHNGGHTLPRVLSAYYTQNMAENWTNIIIVDNASTDNSSDILRRAEKELPLTILYEPRRGKAFGLNQALEHVESDLVIFTDDDAVPRPGWLKALQDASCRKPDMSVFGGAIEPLWEAEPPEWLVGVPLGVTFAITDPGLQEGVIDSGLIWGANMAVRRSVIEAGFRFDESRGPSQGLYIMGVETEYTARLAAHGYKCWFTPKARVQHIVRPFQLEKNWVVDRAFKYGRDIFLKKQHLYKSRFPTIWGVPRWMYVKYAKQWAVRLAATFKGDEIAALAAYWELRYCEGHFYQARRRV